MAGIIGRFFAKRFVGDRVGNYFAQEDPYFEATTETPGGKKARPKKKRVPDGLSDRDIRILKKVRRRAYRLDRSLTCCCCGFRFGWSAVIGFIPVIGDLIDALFALSIIRTCQQADLPPTIISKMYANLMFDFAIGMIPFVGDIADAVFKCNTRNNVLLEQVLRERGIRNPVARPPPKQQSRMRRFFGGGTNSPANSSRSPAISDTGHAVSEVTIVKEDGRNNQGTQDNGQERSRP